MSLGDLALIGVCGLAGPLLASLRGGAVPAVIGEILAGIVAGRTGLRILHTGDPTLSFLSDVGFAMLMLSVGMNVPVHDPSVRAALRGGVARALLVAVIAVGAGELIAQIDHIGHPAVYAVLIASSSAAVVLPVLQERGLGGRSALELIAQVTVADIASTAAIPFVLAPGRAGRALLGTLLVAAGLLAVFIASRELRRGGWVHELRRRGKRERWAIDLRVSLIVLFGLAWLAQQAGTSLLIAGFGCGLVIAAIGGPKRLSTEVLGVAGGFFIPLFFVVLGAKLDMRGVVRDPVMLGLVAALAALTLAVHVAVAVVTRQRPASGLVTSAQLGVPSAIVALGLAGHVLTDTQGGAIIAAALVSVGACALGAARLTPSAGPARRRAGATADAGP